MKRDMELIRKILFYFEEKNDFEHREIVPIDGYDENYIKYHFVLLNDAKLLRCEEVKSSTSDRVICVLPFELTWEGHEYLDKIRNEQIWQKIKNYSSEKGLSLTIDLIKNLANRFIEEVIK